MPTPTMFPAVDHGPVRVLTVTNPGRKNAIPGAGWPQLEAALHEFEQSEQRALVIRGDGDDFCSGADLAVGDVAGGSSSSATSYQTMTAVGRAATALRRVSKPTVAAVDGVAVGAGMNLALGCDVVITTARARFAEIFVKRGLTVDFGGTWLLPRIVGLAKAKELALTGKFLSGEEAVEWGLASRTVPWGKLLDEALVVANELAAGAPLAQRFIKAGLERSFDMTFEQALAYEDQAQAVCLQSADVAEGVRAFLQKRDPTFTGR